MCVTICEFILPTRARPTDAHGARAHECLRAAAHPTSAYCSLNHWSGAKMAAITGHSHKYENAKRRVGGWTWWR